MDTSGIREFLKQLSSTDVDLDDHAKVALRKCCYLLEKMIADRCRNIVRMAKEKAVFTSVHVGRLVYGLAHKDLQSE